MTNFMEILHNDTCYRCTNKKEDLLNFNDDVLGYGRICHSCIGFMISNEEYHMGGGILVNGDKQKQ